MAYKVLVTVVEEMPRGGLHPSSRTVKTHTVYKNLTLAEAKEKSSDLAEHVAALEEE